MKGRRGNQIALLNRECIRTASKLALVPLNEMFPLFRLNPPNPQLSNGSPSTVKSLDNERTYQTKNVIPLPRFTKRIKPALPLK